MHLYEENKTLMATITYKLFTEFKKVCPFIKYVMDISFFEDFFYVELEIDNINIKERPVLVKKSKAAFKEILNSYGLFNYFIFKIMRQNKNTIKIIIKINKLYKKENIFAICKLKGLI